MTISFHGDVSFSPFPVLLPLSLQTFSPLPLSFSSLPSLPCSCQGLAASGSWGCFDEFNRLVPEVLSVCSVQYKCVTDSQKRKTMLPGRGLEHVDKNGKSVPAVANWKFIAADGIEMPLEEGTSGFITMNPGYIGRAELPESLKALFRPITVMVPDRQLIMENMLMAEGFVEAKMLAKKFAS